MPSKQWHRWHSHLSPGSTRNVPVQLSNNHRLPLSPALRPPEHLPDRQRQPLESQSSFRKAVAANPYANALASPVRQCSFTAVRLPQHYLLPFTTRFRRHDNDAKPVPCLVPADDSHQTSRTYAFNSLQLLNRLGVKKTWQRLLGHDLKFGLKNRNDYHWPSNIDRIILERLRRAVTRKLRWLLTKPNANLIVACDPLTVRDSSACVLHLHKESQLEPLPVQTKTGYHLHDLLGDEALYQLVEGTPFANVSAVTLEQSYMTISAHVALARLSMFLNSSGPVAENPTAAGRASRKPRNTEKTEKR